MMNVKKYLAALAGAAVVAVPVAYAAGLFQTLPIIGGAAYCASSNVVGPAQTGITGFGGGVAPAGQTTGLVICGSNAPAGPATFAGTEVIPADLYPPGSAQQAGGAATALVNITQLGQGALLDVTSPATATIPAGTPWYFVDGAQAGAFTVTLPAAPLQGAIQRVVCSAATVGLMTIGPNTGQTIKTAPAAAACAVGNSFAFVFNAVNTTWYRIQ